jgi:pyruvate,orthophosphate dikinase
MVYGNKDGASGSGVVFTRSPSDGTPAPYGEFLVNAQGEDVVSGGRTPQDIGSMAAAFPAAHADLLASLAALEDHYADMMDCEFTVQESTLFMLQTRAGKRAGGAALRIALDMVAEGRVGRADALLMVEPKHLDQLLHPSLDAAAASKDGVVLGSGLAASPGAAVGRLFFTAEDAERAAGEEGGGAVILARTETAAEDVAGMCALISFLFSPFFFARPDDRRASLIIPSTPPHSPPSLTPSLPGPHTHTPGTRPRASSPPAAAPPRTPPSSRAGGAGRVCAAWGP